MRLPEAAATEKLLKIRLLGDLRSSLCCGEGALRKFIFSSLTLNCTEFRQRETLLFPLSLRIVEFSLDNKYTLLYIYIIVHISVPQTLADPTRLRIIEVLQGGEHSVNDIVESVDIDQSGVSRHLRILQRAQFVRVRPEGQKRIYSLCPEPFRDLDEWLSQYRQLWEARLDKFGEALARKRAVKTIAPLKRKSSRRGHHDRKGE